MPMYEGKEPTRFATEYYVEQKGGIMICGIEWGEGKSNHKQDNRLDSDVERKSFFSDKEVNCYPYRDRIVKWFGISGIPLNNINPGSLELSISQTNWLTSQGKNTEGKDVPKEAIKNIDSFINVISIMSPRIILLTSIALTKVLRNLTLKTKHHGVAEVIGSAISPPEIYPMKVHGKKCFSVHVLRYTKTTIIGLPHPTGSRGLSEEHIKILSKNDKFSDVLNSLILCA